MSIMKAILIMYVSICFWSGPAYSDNKQHYKSDSKWELNWEDWCLGKAKGIEEDELKIIRQISSYIAFQRKSGSCLKEQEFLKYSMSYLALKDESISDLSPLISLIDAKNFERLNIRLTRPSQNELNKLGFLETLPTFKSLFLPYSLSNDRHPRCPFEDKNLCR